MCKISHVSVSTMHFVDSSLSSCWKWEDQHLLLSMSPHPCALPPGGKKKKRPQEHWRTCDDTSSKYFQSTSSYSLKSARHHLVAKDDTLWTVEQRTSLEQMGFPCGSVGKESACNAGDPDLIPESGRSSGVGKGYSHSSILAWETSMDCRVHGSQRVRHDWATFRSKNWEPKEVHKISLQVHGGSGLALGLTEANPDFYSAQWTNCWKASLRYLCHVTTELILFDPLPARCDAPGWDKWSLGSAASLCPGTGSTGPSGGRPARRDLYLSAQLSSLDYSTSGEAKGLQWRTSAPCSYCRVPLKPLLASQLIMNPSLQTLLYRPLCSELSIWPSW